MDKETYHDKLTKAAKRLGVLNEKQILDATRLQDGVEWMTPGDVLQLLLASGATTEDYKGVYLNMSTAEMINMVTACGLFLRRYQGNCGSEAIEVLADLEPDQMDGYHEAIRRALRTELGSLALSTPDWFFDIMAGRMAINDMGETN